LIGSFATPDGINWAKSHIEKGLARSGRSWKDIGIASWLYVAVLENEDDSVPDGVRRGVSHALWSSRTVVEKLLQGVELRDADEFMTFLHDAPHEWSPEIMAELRRLIPRDVFDVLALVGTVDQVAERLKALELAGVQECVAWPFPPDGMDVEDYAIKLGSDLLPRVRGLRSRGEYRLVD
jgi:alkanesulfonate monooxygenase SsuD/methylene tetrahydromethanopterin reductase-like flavin-dependent oxidoreductase (luciferase family)